jgi:hypothetical protein
MTGYVPSLYFELAWPYRRPRGPYQAPSGTITLPGPGHLTPCHADREVFLCLIQMSRIQNPALGTVKDVSQWIGARRRQGVTRAHIERVLACEIMRPHLDSYKRHRIGSLAWLDGQRFQIHFDPVIIDEIGRATPFSLDQAARLRARPAEFDLFLCLTQCNRLFREFREFTHEVDPRDILPLASDLCKARQDILRRVDAIQDMIEAHVAPAAVGTGILLDFDTPKRVIHLGTSRVDWERRRQRAETIRRMPPDERRAVGRMMAMATEWERRMEQPDPWAETRDAIQRAEDETARILERLTALTEV